jgi:hypothetical protein
MELTGPIPPREALAIYLQDHHAGAQAGIALARRAAGNQVGTPELERIVRDIEEDEQVLLRVMAAVGARPSAVKAITAKLAERLGRLKLNGQLLRRSPLSPVIELELLLSGVKSKKHVWLLLRDATDLELDDVDLDRMIARVDEQVDRLDALWRDAARAAFPDRVAAGR